MSHAQGHGTHSHGHGYPGRIAGFGGRLRQRAIGLSAALAAIVAFSSAPAVAQEYGPYPLDGPPYGSDYYPFDYNLDGGRTRPGMPPPAPYPFRMEYPQPDYNPEGEARRMMCPPGMCGPEDDE